VGVDVVRRLWAAFDSCDWELARACVHDDVVVDWPQSGERWEGREAYIGVNERYPGEWEIDVRRVVDAGDVVVLEAWIEHSERERSTFAVALYELRDGRIARGTEYWADPFDPPPERIAT
jgi:ketosteroid isomerase-like protein